MFPHRSPRRPGPAVGNAKSRAQALQVAELILSPLGDRDVVNSKVGPVEERVAIVPLAE